MSLDFTRFYYETKGSFKGLDLLSQLVGLAKGYTSLKPIEDKSVPIFLHKEMKPEEYMKPESLDMFVHYSLCSGTKPFDMVAYVAAQGATSSARMELFDFKVGKYDPAKQSVAVALLASSIVMFVSRGAFPAQDEARGRTPLPTFVRNMLPGLDTEKSLADKLGSFDFKHIEVKHFFEPENLKGWEDILANRLNLGVAGHKPLKVALELSAKFPADAKRPAEKYVAMLVAAQNVAKGGFFPSLHPAQQEFSTKYKGFYVQSLAAIYDALPGDKAEKIKVMRTSNALKNEKLLDQTGGDEPRIISVARTYQGWNLEEMIKDMGNPRRFEAGKAQAGAAFVPTDLEGSAPKKTLSIGGGKQ